MGENISPLSTKFNDCLSPPFLLSNVFVSGSPSLHFHFTVLLKRTFQMNQGKKFKRRAQHLFCQKEKENPLILFSASPLGQQSPPSPSQLHFFFPFIRGTVLIIYNISQSATLSSFYIRTTLLIPFTTNDLLPVWVRSVALMGSEMSSPAVVLWHCQHGAGRGLPIQELTLPWATLSNLPTLSEVPPSPWKQTSLAF